MIQYLTEAEQVSSFLLVMLLSHQVAQLIVTHDLLDFVIIITHQHLDPLMVLCISVMNLLNNLGSHNLTIRKLVQIGESQQFLRRESRKDDWNVKMILDRINLGLLSRNLWLP